MICQNCGAQIRDGVQFCPNCGSKQGAQQPAAAPQQPAGPQPHYASQQQPNGAGQAPQQPQREVTPYAQQAQAYSTGGRPANGDVKTISLVGMICGIAGLVFDFIFLPLGLILGIVGIVASGLAMSRNKGGNNGMAVAGLVCGIIALVIAVPFCICGAALCTAGAAGSAGLADLIAQLR